MAIEMKRLTFTEQASRNAAFRGRALAIEVRGAKRFSRAAEVIKHLRVVLAAKDVEVKFFTPLGLEFNAAALIGKTTADFDAMAAQIDALFQTAAARKPQIEIPEMIDDPRLPFKVMKDVATGGQFAGLVRAGYEIKGYKADELKSIIADETNANKGTGQAALLDGRALAEELNRQNPGRKFRVPTEEELIKLNSLVGDQLSGRDFWIWTETKYGESTFVLRRLFYGGRNNYDPEYRSDSFAVRLVEDR